MSKGVMFQYFEWNCLADGSLWREVKDRAIEIKNLGTTAIWLPPAYKGMSGAADVGYAPYDLYDLGEFEQKGSVRTKYGTREEFLAAVAAIQDAGMDAYADIVLNHRMGGDETEEVEVVEISNDDRNKEVSAPYKIKPWSYYKFDGRAKKYSDFQWHWRHFVAFGADSNQPNVNGKIFRVKEKTFSGEVDFEHGNFDYLMGADVDQYDPEVRAQTIAWGKWFLDTTGVNGFRLDAVKHIPFSFFDKYLAEMRKHRGDKELFAVGEYWSGSMADMQKYIDVTKGAMRLFDVPLHYKFHEAAKKGRGFNLQTIFDDTLVKTNPLMAVTFVDNHDSQPGQSLESWVDDWFKPLAYALILLREHGYPCLFYGDYFGNVGTPKGQDKLTSHRRFIDDCIQARQKFCYGLLRDYFDHPQCVGWAWTGDAEHNSAIAVVMSVGENGIKKMSIGRPNLTFREVTGKYPEPITTDANGDAEFTCPGGSVSIWCST